MDEKGEKPIVPVLRMKNYMADEVNAAKIKYILSTSDAESLTLKDVLALADDESKELWENMTFGYTKDRGDPLLRKEAAKLHNVKVEDVNVVCPREGIFCAMNVLTKVIQRSNGNAPFSAVATYPAWQPLYEHLAELGANMSYWKVKFNAQRGWHFNLDDLMDILTDDTRILVLNFPHNPTGATLSNEEMLQLAALCKERGIYIFSDEIYGCSENDGSPAAPSMCSLYDDCVSLSGVSKTMALPGLRIGWLCTKNAALNKALSQYKDFTTFCASRPSEILALIAMKNLPAVVRRTMDIVKENLRLWNEFFARHADAFEWVPPSAGLVGLVRMRGWLRELEGAEEFCQRALDFGGVLLLPGPQFGFGDDGIRVGLSRRGLAEGLAVLGKFVDEEKARAQKKK